MAIRSQGWGSWLVLIGLSACAPGDEPMNATDADGSESSTGRPAAEGSGTSTTDGPVGDDTGDTTSTTGIDGSTDETSTGADPACGNGIVEDEETCDDAGESTRCNADCTAAACGDGIVNAAAGEVCDDAAASETCDADCTTAACGDGNLNAAAGELCDDGGESPACNVDCTPAACGDGIFNAAAGELCDEGGPTALCDADCSLVSCGDGIVNVAAGEACDDAGESATCNVDCSPSACGDGITNLTAGESCDDAGPSLACDVDCSLSACGDGLANAVAGEACDDAGESAACDPDCTLAACGDSTLNATAGEICDGTVLGGATCESEGFVVGLLGCTPGCAYDLDSCVLPPAAPVLTLGFSAIKQFDFSWAAVPDADHYLLEESAAPGEPFLPLGGSIVGTSISLTMPLHLRHQASYRLRACNPAGCTDSAPVGVTGSLAEAIGYFKASNPDIGDTFGWSVALSEDGSTLAVGAYTESSNATGIDGDQDNDLVGASGAVYVFVRDDAGTWTQQAYVKASNPGVGDWFGHSVALSDDGSTLAVGAPSEDSNAIGIDGDQANDFAAGSGAAYVFVRDGAGTWSQQAYVKASNPWVGDTFGHALALSGDGDTLAVGAYNEDSASTGVNGDQGSNTAPESGAVYVFVRDGADTWSQQAYVKSSNPDMLDWFGRALALSDAGDILAVGAINEASNATGVGGDQANDSAPSAGAVYLFARNGLGVWSQQAYVKASNTSGGDYFGSSVTLSGDGNTLAVGAFLEDSAATGIGGDQASNATMDSGAVYVLVRSGGSWVQQAYVKASNPAVNDWFGMLVALSDDGDTLAVTAYGEDGSTTGLGGNQADDAATAAGAVFVLVRDEQGAWSQRVYAKASNTASNDQLGFSGLALSGDALTLAVGAHLEDGGSAGIGGDQANEAIFNAGAVYLY